MSTFKKRAFFYLLFLYLPILTAALFYIPHRKTEKLSDFLKVQFPLRQWALKANAYTQIRLLKSTNLGNIHIGKYPWVFYITESDGNSARDLWGLSNEHIEDDWAKYLEVASQKPLGFDAKYLLVLPPNKETVYSENLSYLFTGYFSQNTNNYSKVAKTARSIMPDNLVMLRDTLTQGKDRLQTYHSGDTHWNRWGAYLAHLEIIAATNKIFGTHVQPILREPFKSAETASHDILLMFNGADRAISYEMNPGENIDIDFPSLPYLVNESSYSVTINPKASKTVWFLGDSFGEVLKPFLSPYFNKLIFIKGVNKVLRKNIIRAHSEHGAPDFIIEERVERYLSNPVKYIDYSKEVSTKSGF